LVEEDLTSQEIEIPDAPDYLWWQNCAEESQEPVIEVHLAVEADCFEM